VPGCLHGGGSPDAARLMLRGAIDIERLVKMAAELAGIEEAVEEPPARK